jgi:hypothetical protein
MPDSNALVSHSLTGQPFGYTAADMGDLGATEYTLVTLVVDESSSVSPFKAELEKCIKSAIDACKFSPRSDFLMLRLVAFNQNMREIHGFKQLADCDPNDYDGCLSPSGSTLLFESSRNAISATNDYGKQLVDDDYECNALVIILTDGMDNESGPVGPAEVGQALNQISADEALESILSILVGVGIGQYHDVQQYLDDFKEDAGIDQFIPIKDADDKSLAKLGNFISKSVVSQSSSLGTGDSQPLTF